MTAQHPPNRVLSPIQVSLLDGVERAIRRIANPLTCATCYNRQAALALTKAGFQMTPEVCLPDGRRCDFVVVTARGNVVVEVDGRQPRAETLHKFRDLDPSLLRMLVLRERRQPPVVPWTDRVVCVQTSHRPLGWLVDGYFELAGSARPMLEERKGPRAAASTVVADIGKIVPILRRR